MISHCGFGLHFPLMINDNEKHLLASCMFSLEKCSDPLLVLKSDCLFYLLLSCMGSLCILDISSLLHI